MKTNKVEIIFIFSIVLLIALRVFYYENKLKSDRLFTIGKVNRIGYSSSGAYCEYTYYENYKKHIQSNGIGNYKKPKVGETFLVLFTKENPSFGRIVLGAPIDEKEYKAEYTSIWKDIPFDIDTLTIEKAINGNGYRFFENN